MLRIDSLRLSLCLASTTSVLTDAFSRAGFGLGATRLNGWIRVRIDHVLTGPGWYADSVKLGPDLGSDHLPLIVDLTLVPKS